MCAPPPPPQPPPVCHATGPQPPFTALIAFAATRERPPSARDALGGALGIAGLACVALAQRWQLLVEEPQQQQPPGAVEAHGAVGRRAADEDEDGRRRCAGAAEEEEEGALRYAPPNDVPG